jgi:acyl-CoA thioesterase I
MIEVSRSCPAPARHEIARRLAGPDTVSRRSALAGSVISYLAMARSTGVAEVRMPIVLAFGDSFTAGLGLPKHLAFPAQLEARLRDHGLAVKVLNAGVSGETTAGGLARIDQVLAQKPDFVILELGANDALRGVQPAVVRSNLVRIITKITAAGAKLLLTGMRAPQNWGAEYQAAFDRIYPDLASVYGVPLYPFFLKGVALRGDLNQPDKLHPNERGVLIIVDNIAPVMIALIRAQTASQP